MGARARPPEVSGMANGTQQSIVEGQRLRLECVASGSPAPHTLVWLRDDEPIQRSRRIRIRTRPMRRRQRKQPPRVPRQIDPFPLQGGPHLRRIRSGRRMKSGRGASEGANDEMARTDENRRSSSRSGSSRRGGRRRGGRKGGGESRSSSSSSNSRSSSAGSGGSPGTSSRRSPGSGSTTSSGGGGGGGGRRGSKDARTGGKSRGRGRHRDRESGAAGGATSTSTSTSKLRSQLSIRVLTLADRGRYKCVATSVFGQTFSSVQVDVVEAWRLPVTATPCPKEDYCLNGGTCMFIPSIGELVCHCAEGWKGQRCEHKQVYTTKARKCNGPLGLRLRHSRGVRCPRNQPAQLWEIIQQSLANSQKASPWTKAHLLNWSPPPSAGGSEPWTLLRPAQPSPAVRPSALQPPLPHSDFAPSTSDGPPRRRNRFHHHQRPPSSSSSSSSSPSSPSSSSSSSSSSKQQVVSVAESSSSPERRVILLPAKVPTLDPMLSQITLEHKNLSRRRGLLSPDRLPLLRTTASAAAAPPSERVSSTTSTDSRGFDYKSTSQSRRPDIHPTSTQRAIKISRSRTSNSSSSQRRSGQPRLPKADPRRRQPSRHHRSRRRRRRRRHHHQNHPDVTQTSSPPAPSSGGQGEASEAVARRRKPSPFDNEVSEEVSRGLRHQPGPTMVVPTATAPSSWSGRPRP